MSPLLWTSKSLDKLCAALKDMQHDVCPNVIAKLLRKPAQLAEQSQNA